MDHPVIDWLGPEGRVNENLKDDIPNWIYYISDFNSPFGDNRVSEISESGKAESKHKSSLSIRT